ERRGGEHQLARRRGANRLALPARGEPGGRRGERRPAGDRVLEVEVGAARGGGDGHAARRHRAGGVGVEGASAAGGGEGDRGGGGDVGDVAEVVLRLHGGHRRAGAGDDVLGRGGEGNLRGAAGDDRLALAATGEAGGGERQRRRAGFGVFPVEGGAAGAIGDRDEGDRGGAGAVRV